MAIPCRNWYFSYRNAHGVESMIERSMSIMERWHLTPDTVPDEIRIMNGDPFASIFDDSTAIVAE